MARAIKRVSTWPRRASIAARIDAGKAEPVPVPRVVPLSRRELGNLSPEGHKGSSTRSSQRKRRRCLPSMLTGQLQRLPTCAFTRAQVLEMSARAGGKILQRGY